MEPAYDRHGVTIYHGDALTVLRGLDSDQVNCCVTSPPYWNLRDYQVEGQLGGEETPGEYVDNLVQVFREVRRVLRDDGTLWLNLGDSYAQDTKWGGTTGGKHAKGLHGTNGIGRNRSKTGLPGKSLVGIPWRVALALQADGWILRSDIIWHKPNVMPESVKDRLTRNHEYIFLLTKSPRYYYDQKAINEPASPDTHARYARGRSNRHKWANGGPGDQTIATSFEHMRRPGVNPKAAQNAHGSRQNASFSEAVKDVVGERNKRTVWSVDEDGALLRWLVENYPDLLAHYVNEAANKPSVWSVPTSGFPDAHFATFPPKLIAPCILAGCPEGGVVLDTFLGSGTAAEVARANGCKCVGVELNAEYIELAKKRLRQPSLLRAQ